MFSTLQGMREKASFLMFFEKVRESIQILENDDPILPRERKVSSHYELGEGPAEFVSTFVEHYHQFFYQAIDMAVNCTLKLTLKFFRQWKYCC